MSEDTEVENQEADTSQYTETELKAMELGWQPDFEGDENKTAKTAEQFLELQPLYDDLRTKNRKIRQMDEKIKALDEATKNWTKKAYERAREDIKKEIAQAHDEGDTKTAVEKTDEMAKLDKEYEQQEAPQNNEAQEVFDEWVEKNQWYKNDPKLAAVADGMGNYVARTNPDLLDNQGNVVDQKAFLDKVAEEVKKENPEKFKGARKTPSVEGDTGGKGTSKKKYSIKSLDEEDRKIAERVIQSGTMDEETYMKRFLGEA